MFRTIGITSITSIPSRTTGITSRTASPRSRGPAAAVLGAALVVVLAACSTAPTGEPAPESASAAESVEIIDAWVKAVDEGMTGAFGTLQNTGDAEVTLVGASTDAAPMVELHETVMGGGDGMVMQQKEGGFAIAASGVRELAPGSDHIMLMGVTEALMPGDEVMVTLAFSDGSTLQHAFTVKEFTGANEEYMGDMDGTGTTSHSTTNTNDE